MKAWIVTPMATYRFMESENLNLDVLAGARYLDWQFDEDDDAGDIFDRITVNGPIVGFKYHF